MINKLAITSTHAKLVDQRYTPGRVYGQYLPYVVVYTKKTTILCTLLFQEHLHGKSLIIAPLKHL